MNGIVSIIVPVYNVEKYLDRCIQSAVNQTYKDLEIILVDDGSKDNCPSMCDEWSAKDSRIKVIHKENGGLSSARNAGLNIFKGDFVIFLDSDDWLEPDAVEAMMLCALQNGADMVCCGFYFDDVQGNSDWENEEKLSFCGGDIAKNLLLDNIRPEVCAKLYAASLIKNFRFNESLKYAEDLPFNFHLMRKAKKLISLGTPFYHYIQNSGASITTPYMTDARAQSPMLFKEILNCCKDDDELLQTAYFRFTVFTFAVLSRVMNSKEFSRKYYNLLADELLKVKTQILSNRYVGKKHKLSIRALSVSKPLFKTAYRVALRGMALYKRLKSLVAFVVFDAQTFAKTVSARAFIAKHKNNAVFLLLTPCHVNYGDHAIAYAEKQLLCDKSIFEITGDQLAIYLQHPFWFKKMLRDAELVFQGGGYLGTLWFPYGERLMRSTCLLAPENKIVVMPQSVYFENNDYGARRKKESEKIYGGCKNITFVLRDKTSYNIIKEMFPEKDVRLIPDVVLCLNECAPSEREGAAMVFRNDMERKISESQKQKAENLLKETYKTVKKIDMLSESRISVKQRETQLKAHFDRFRHCELVLTDRLHGMIFSAITGTPCVVFPSKSHKVKALYDWIFADCEYIIFTDDENEIRKFITQIRGRSFKYDNLSVKKYFDELKSLV